LHWLEESSEIDFSMAYPEPADFVDSIVAAIIVIVSSEWFTRLWVIQEFILAANVQIWVGDCQAWLMICTILHPDQ
jgi:hypothetical protein